MEKGQSKLRKYKEKEKEQKQENDKEKVKEIGKASNETKQS